MPLSETARSRLADILEREPTKNSELQAAWDMDSGSEVHQYLESELKPYYYRDDNSLIRVTPEGEAVLSGETGDGPAVAFAGIEEAVFGAVPGPEERSASVVAILHEVRDQGAPDAGVEAVRAALRTLTQKDVLERIDRTVPTYRLAVPRSDVTVLETE
ncbi:DUF5797 family protein [Halodesulfurarchaeum sp. HSR-GB]|uniref:DUF5797 family protein n=1 Tax=Halodesulfurarchaeum sp. HSR-GB TaxID=3074077 RepID=UPI00285F86AE|nr:DUF5797 family protein [Halodesulfurarchaeum sp. HSR-GB]MDR5656908.1 DUF5797 family protein [Halodesulfurarchaeum sp. HSR-GB]